MIRLTKCQERALMFLYFWNRFYRDERAYWWTEDCQMKRITVKCLIDRGLATTDTGHDLYITDRGNHIAYMKWIRSDKYKPLFLQMNSVYGDGDAL